MLVTVSSVSVGVTAECCHRTTFINSSFYYGIMNRKMEPDHFFTSFLVKNVNNQEDSESIVGDITVRVHYAGPVSWTPDSRAAC